MLLSCVPFLYDFPRRKHVAAWFCPGFDVSGVRGCWNWKVNDAGCGGMGVGGAGFQASLSGLILSISQPMLMALVIGFYARL